MRNGFIQREDGWAVGVCFRTPSGWQKPTKGRTWWFPNRQGARKFINRMRQEYGTESARISLTQVEAA